MKKRLFDILETVLYFMGVLVVTWLIITFVGQRTSVVGSSMDPTLQDGDQLILNKISYRFSEPERFDVIVFPYRYERKTYYVKRIIGLPGETIMIDDDGVIYVDGEVLEENYGKEPMAFNGIAAEPITLADDQYFVLGDNRNNSSDSRDPSVGLIQRNELLGKVWIRIMPLSGFGRIR